MAFLICRIVCFYPLFDRLEACCNFAAKNQSYWENLWKLFWTTYRKLFFQMSSSLGGFYNIEQHLFWPKQEGFPFCCALLLGPRPMLQGAIDLTPTTARRHVRSMQIFLTTTLTAGCPAASAFLLTTWLIENYRLLINGWSDFDRTKPKTLLGKFCIDWCKVCWSRAKGRRVYSEDTNRHSSYSRTPLLLVHGVVAGREDI